MLEYIFLITIIATTMLVFQKYVVRALSGRWKGSGDSLSAGRQFDPKKTKECVYDFQYFNIWYDVKALEAIDGCVSACFSGDVGKTTDEIEEDKKQCKCCVCRARSNECDENSENLDTTCASSPCS